MASLCSRIFQIEITVSAMCRVILQDSDPISIGSADSTTPFRKDFSYATGLNPNPSHDNYGFTLTTGTLPTGVSITDIDWGHERPDPQITSFVSNYVTGNIVVDSMYVGDVARSIDLTVQLNTGT